MSESFFRHPLAVVETERVGAGTRIWAFAHVLPGATIGADCNICDHVFIENDVTVGDRVTVKCGVQLWDGVTLEDDVFVGPNATFTNDPMPRSRRRPERFTPTRVARGASIGANATLLAGVTIGAGAMVGAGAVVTASVPPNAIVVGNPASITGYVDAPRVGATAAAAGSARADTIEGVDVIELPRFADLRGSLAVAELGKHLPFEPRRCFFVFDVPSRQVRGEHAHRVQHQLLVCVKGECSIAVDNGADRREYLLDRPWLALHVRPLVWATQYRFTADAVLAVFASAEYDPADYIREYEEFLSIVRG